MRASYVDLQLIAGGRQNQNRAGGESQGQAGQPQHFGGIQVDHKRSSGQLSAIAGAPVAGWLRKDRNKTPLTP